MRYIFAPAFVAIQRGIKMLSQLCSQLRTQSSELRGGEGNETREADLLLEASGPHFWWLQVALKSQAWA